MLRLQRGVYVLSDNYRSHRNHPFSLAQALRQLSLMEEWGSGYHRIVTACNAHNYPIPEWQEIGSVIRVVFAPHPQTKDTHSLDPGENVPVNVPVSVPVNERQQWFLNQLKGGIQCKPVDIAEK